MLICYTQICFDKNTLRDSPTSTPSNELDRGLQTLSPWVQKNQFNNTQQKQTISSEYKIFINKNLFKIVTKRIIKKTLTILRQNVRFHIGKCYYALPLQKLRILLRTAFVFIIKRTFQKTHYTAQSLVTTKRKYTKDSVQFSSSFLSHEIIGWMIGLVFYNSDVLYEIWNDSLTVRNLRYRNVSSTNFNCNQANRVPQSRRDPADRQTELIAWA